MDCERCPTMLGQTVPGSGKNVVEAGKGVSVGGGVGVACPCTLTGSETDTRCPEDGLTIGPEPDAQAPPAAGLISSEYIGPKTPAGSLTIAFPPLASFNAATISTAFCLVVSNVIFAHVSLSTATLSFLSSLFSISS